MKKFHFILLFLCLFAGKTATAQDGLVLGPNLAFYSGSGTTTTAIGIKSQKYFSENWRTTFGVDYLFLGNSANSFIDVQAIGLGFNTDLNYVHELSDGFSAYGLAGVNFLLAVVHFDGNVSASTVTSFALGGGVEYQINDKIKAFAEPKLLIRNNTGFIFSTGVLFQL